MRVPTDTRGDFDGTLAVEPQQKERREGRSSVLLIGFEPLSGRAVRDALGGPGRFSNVRWGLRAPDAFDVLTADQPSAAVVAWETINGLTLRRMSQASPDTSMVVLASHLTPEQASALIHCGAVAALDRRFCRDVLAETVLLACRGMEIRHRPAVVESACPPDWAQRLAKLSSREMDILGFLDCGESTAAIAELLGLSPHTVKAQTQAIYRKLEVHSRAELHAQRLQQTQRNPAPQQRPVRVRTA